MSRNKGPVELCQRVVTITACCGKSESIFSKTVKVPKGYFKVDGTVDLPYWPVFFSEIPGAHKNTWNKTKVDLSSVPHLGVAEIRSLALFCLRGTARHVSGASKRFVRKGFGQGLGNEVLFFYFCPFGRIFLFVPLLSSKCAARGSV